MIELKTRGSLSSSHTDFPSVPHLPGSCPPVWNTSPSDVGIAGSTCPSGLSSTARSLGPQLQEKPHQAHQGHCLRPLSEPLCAFVMAVIPLDSFVSLPCLPFRVDFLPLQCQAHEIRALYQSPISWESVPGRVHGVRQVLRQGY